MQTVISSEQVSALKAKLQNMAVNRPARIRERLKRLEELQSRQVHEVSDLDVNDFFALHDERKERERIISGVFRPSLGKGYDDLVNSEIRIHEEELVNNKDELDALMSATKGAIAEAAFTRLAIREKVAKHVAALGKIDLSDFKTEDQDVLITALVKDDLIKEGAGMLVHKGRSYVVFPNSDAALELYNRVVKLWEDIRELRHERREEYAEEAAPYLLSRESATELKADKGTIRNLGEFLNGKGSRCFVPVVIEHRQSGEKRFGGEALLERDGNSGILCRKVTPDSARLAHLLFSYSFMGKKGRERRWRSDIAVEVAQERNIANVQPNLLRGAMEQMLEREEGREERRNIAADLLDVSKIQRPLTFDDLRAGEQGTCLVDIMFQNGNERSVPLTFHLDGNGEGKFRLSKAVPGSVEKHAFLKACQPWRPVTDLNSPEWRGTRFANRKCERDWQTARAAAALEAAKLTHANCKQLLGVEGRDGVYAVRSFWRRRDREPIPLGYVFERRGTSLKVVWALPGDSVNILGDEIGKSYDISDLPAAMRGIFRNVYISLFGQGRYVQFPRHLLPPEKTEKQAPAPPEDGQATE